MTNFPISTGTAPVEGASAGPSGVNILLGPIRTTQFGGLSEGPIFSDQVARFHRSDAVSGGPLGPLSRTSLLFLLGTGRQMGHFGGSLDYSANSHQEDVVGRGLCGHRRND